MEVGECYDIDLGGKTQINVKILHIFKRKIFFGLFSKEFVNFKENAKACYVSGTISKKEFISRII